MYCFFLVINTNIIIGFNLSWNFSTSSLTASVNFRSTLTELNSLIPAITGRVFHPQPRFSAHTVTITWTVMFITLTTVRKKTTTTVASVFHMCVMWRPSEKEPLPPAPPPAHFINPHFPDRYKTHHTLLLITAFAVSPEASAHTPVSQTPL